ncbi:hypothetical protein AAG570_009170 [Ranatra chinensis]|uniref:Uncharacterized protein n=1 Tax=Ranatra chinensis TaxID=642074 RepID=A0ABD0YT15_9HEMI
MFQKTKTRETTENGIRRSMRLLLLCALVASCLAQDAGLTPDQQKWVDKGTEMIKNNIGKQGELGKQFVEWISSAAQSGIDLGSLSTHEAVNAIQGILDSANKVGGKGIDVGANIAGKGFGLIGSAAELTPSVIGKILQAIAERGQQGAKQAGDIGNSALGKGTSLGKDVLSWVNEITNKVTDSVSNVITHGKDRVTSSIDKGVDRITGRVDAGSKLLQSILDRLKFGNRKPQQGTNTTPPPAQIPKPEPTQQVPPPQKPAEETITTEAPAQPAQPVPAPQ